MILIIIMLQFSKKKLFVKCTQFSTSSSTIIIESNAQRAMISPFLKGVSQKFGNLQELFLYLNHLLTNLVLVATGLYLFCQSSVKCLKNTCIFSWLSICGRFIHFLTPSGAFRRVNQLQLLYCLFGIQCNTILLNDMHVLWNCNDAQQSLLQCSTFF